ncbi:MAG: GDP-mannose 4,6-dehydratase [Candidatus Omnitrophica bacterium]|nr:GDP-mannose 4,6-dehydratase [Candidatus Omnitrophota bacterium]
MRVLVTGAGGFVGGHMTAFLRGTGAGVCTAPHRNLRGGFLAVKVLLKKLKPDRIIHLAAQSSASLSWNAPRETILTNVLCELNILEAARQAGLSPSILIAGSSEEYGLVQPEEIPIKEKTPLRPLSPYAVSKIAQSYLAYPYHRVCGMRVIRARAFPHTGPGQRADFALSSFARQIALIEAGRQRPVIETGNLGVVRDFTDVRDVVRAYWLLLEKGKSGEVYNVASGRGVALKEIIRIYQKHAKVKFRLHRDPKRVRPLEPAVVVGDASRLRVRTGWKARIPLERTLADLLNFWRNQIGP